jgi:hypothetical protein
VDVLARVLSQTAVANSLETSSKAAGEGGLEVYVPELLQAVDGGQVREAAELVHRRGELALVPRRPVTAAGSLLLDLHEDDLSQRRGRDAEQVRR